MSDQIHSESPLARFNLDRRAINEQGSGGIQARERRFLGYLNLRGDATDVRFVAAIQAITCADLPLVPNATANGTDNSIYWLGPDEWLIVTSAGHVRALSQKIRSALPDIFYALTDISSGLTSVALSGNPICELLAKECALDFDIRSFPAKTCAQSKLAKTPILIRRTDFDSFEVVIRRSFAEYFWLWLEDASAEYGLIVNS